VPRKLYVDTCVWLNLFKKESTLSQGIPLWKHTEDFIAKVIVANDILFYSGYVLRELTFAFHDDAVMRNKRVYIEKIASGIDALEEDRSLARKIEFDSNYGISYYDCVHIAICKRICAILVTRDKALLTHARRYITAEKPEYLY
jgi:predicted nucleic acid-binding protein